MEKIHVQYPTYLLGEAQIPMANQKNAMTTLNTMKGLYQIALQALELAETSKLGGMTFDPLTTTCACHLYALKMVETITKLKSDALFQAHFQAVKRALQLNLAVCEETQVKLLKGIKLGKAAELVATMEPQGMAKSKTAKLASLLSHFDLNCEMSEDIANLIHMHMWTLVRQYDRVGAKVNDTCLECKNFITLEDGVEKEVTNINKLALTLQSYVGDVNKSLLSNQVLKVAREMLIASAVVGVRDAAKIHCDSLTQAMISKMNEKTVEGKIALPDYYSLMATMQIALNKQIPILLKFTQLDHVHCNVEPDRQHQGSLWLVPKQGAYVPTLPASSQAQEPMIVIQIKRMGHALSGESKEAFLRRLLDQPFNFMHLCKLDGAQHKQYPNDPLFAEASFETIPLFNQTIEEGELGQYKSLHQEALNAEKHKLEELKAEAIAKGCSLANSSLFMMDHIYASTLEQELSQGCPNPEDVYAVIGRQI